MTVALVAALCVLGAGAIGAVLGGPAGMHLCSLGAAVGAIAGAYPW